jgi:hypothetical protein
MAILRYSCSNFQESYTLQPPGLGLMNCNISLFQGEVVTNIIYVQKFEELKMLFYSSLWFNIHIH